MQSNLVARVPTQYWVLLILIVWGGLTLLLLREDAYGLDEGAVRALLLNWSIVDNVANPIVVFGVPDFRALLFIPLGIYWSGSLMAAKVFTLLTVFAAAVLLYQWRCRAVGKETALIATGLLLICPVTLLQIDALGVGPYLLLLFALGAWLDQRYRSSVHRFGGMYFSQPVLVAITVTLHPMGLAYPIALLWGWYKEPIEKRQQRYMYIGVALAVAFVAVLQAGWHGLEWWSNPLHALTSAALGPQLETGSDAGVLVATVAGSILLAVIILNARELVADFIGSMLLASVLLGLVAADLAWAMLVVVLVLYYGISKLIALNEFMGGPGLMRQRGVVLVVLIVLATLFMNIDKAYYRFIKSGVLPPQDQLMHTLALEAADTSKSFRAVSQWPARTMIIVKRDVLPLPPPAKDGTALLKMIPGITHLVFDPYDAANASLARNIAALSGVMETLVVQPEGVIVRMRVIDKLEPAAP